MTTTTVTWDDLGPAIQADLARLAHTPADTDHRTGVFAVDGNLFRFGLLDKATGHLTPLATRLIEEHTMARKTTTVDDTTLEDRLTPLAAELAQLAEQADRIKARQDELKAAIRDLVPAPDTYTAGQYTVVVSANRRFDEAKALDLVPEVLRPAVTYPETRVDKDRLRVLAPEVFEAAQVVYTERITVKAAS